MKLTNEDKAFNSKLNTGIGIMEAHMHRQADKLIELEKGVEVYSKVGNDLYRARLLVTRADIKMRGYYKEQTEFCIALLESNKIKGGE
tara:strand:+ start:373 stop:636 length:264 start_codon:yes stop_codon:yes gene_type:complete